MDQQFSLTWNNFHGNLTKGFAGLLGNSEFVDVTIAVDGHLLQAHKVILSICSPYFKRMFQTNPCQHPIVVLRDVSHKAMKDLLQFMYHGEVSVKREDLNNFIGTAEVLQIKGLTNKQTDEENCEKEQELPINMEKQNHIDTESTASDSFDTPPNNITQNNDDEIVKQREFIQKLQRFSNLKRKSNDFLQKNFYNDMLITEKRTKLKEKPSHNRSNNHHHHHQHNSHFETMKKYYDDNLVDIKTSLNTHHVQKPTDLVKDKVDIQEEEHSSSVEIKTECEDEIIVTDPAVCTMEKEYDSSKDGNRDSYVPLEFQAPQDKCTSLSSLFMDLKNLVNGKVPMLRNSLELYPSQTMEHRLTTIPQKEDGKKKYPQRSCRLCWRIGKRRDTRFMCSACELPFCKSPCFDIHCNDILKVSQLQSDYYAQ